MIIPAGYAQANFIFAGPDFPTGAQITLGLNNNARTDSLEDQADEIALLFANNLAGYWSGEQDNTTVLLKEGPNSTGNQVEVPGAGLGTGNSTSDLPAAAVLIRKNTAFGGRKGRGRWYWPSPSVLFVDDGGQLSSGFVSGLQSAIDAFHGDLVTANLEPYVLHADAGTVPYPITSWSVQTTLATQRRRQRR